MSDVLLVVPCYNEADRLDAGAFRRFLSKVEGFSLLFVNDGSTDTTGDLLRSFCAAEDRAGVLELEVNSGKAEAVRRGMLKALEGSYAWVGFLDADLATPLEEMERLYRVLHAESGYQAAFGARIIRLGSNIRRHPVRYLLGRLFSQAVSVLFHIPVYDSQCGAKLFSRSAAGAIFNQPFVSSWFFDIELLERLRMTYADTNLREVVTETPLREWYEKGGSKVKLGNFMKVPWELWRIKRHYNKARISAAQPVNSSRSNG